MLTGKSVLITGSAPRPDPGRRREFARTNVTGKPIRPGTVTTPAIEWPLRKKMRRDGTMLESAEAQCLAIRQLSRRFVKDANEAGLIAFLCEFYSGDINGADLAIDGAWLAGRG